MIPAAEAPAGMVLWIDEERAPSRLLETGTSKPGDAYKLIGPYYGVGVTAVRTAPKFELSGADLSNVGLPTGVPRPAVLSGGEPEPIGGTAAATLRAPAGQEFVLARLTRDKGFDGRSYTGLSKVETTLKVAGKSVKLGKLPHTTALAIAVPEKGPVLLVTGDPGHLQSLDLRTGKRVTGIAAMYAGAPSDTGGFDGDSGYAWVRAGGRLFSISAFHWRAELRPWIAGAGYARKGRAWLVFDADLMVSVENGTARPKLSLRLDPDTAFRLGTSSATARPAEGTGKRTDPVLLPGSDSFSAAFEVDDSFRKGVVGVSIPGGKLLVDGEQRSYRIVENKGLTSMPVRLS